MGQTRAIECAVLLEKFFGSSPGKLPSRRRRWRHQHWLPDFVDMRFRVLPKGLLLAVHHAPELDQLPHSPIAAAHARGFAVMLCDSATSVDSLRRPRPWFDRPKRFAGAGEACSRGWRGLNSSKARLLCEGVCGASLPPSVRG